MAIKRKKILQHATTWINLENIFRERSRLLKTIYNSIFYEISKCIGKESGLVVASGWKEIVEEKGRVTGKAYEVCFEVGVGAGGLGCGGVGG